jgi:hypothetical protein
VANDPSESLLASPHGKGQNVTRSWLPLLEIPLPTVVQDRVDVQANSIRVTLEAQLLEWERDPKSRCLGMSLFHRPEAEETAMTHVVRQGCAVRRIPE